MNNKLIIRLYIILLTAVIIAAAGVYSIFYAMTYNAMIGDMRERSRGVLDYIVQVLTTEDLVGAVTDVRIRSEVQDRLNLIQGIGGIQHLYVAWEGGSGDVYTSLITPSGNYRPPDSMMEELRVSIRDGIAVSSSQVHNTEEHGDLFAIYWPVLNADGQVLLIVAMEYDVDSLQESHRRTAMYSLAVSAALILLISVVAYLSISKASEPFYQKLAYTDFLTGYENRLSFEHRLRECEELLNENEDAKVTLIIFDVNNLKTINDTFGHKAGDAYLTGIANVLAKHIGNSGKLFRIGGDEFAAVVVGKQQSEIDALLLTLGEERTMISHPHRFSCAFGAATFDKEADNSLRDLFGRADEAMYDEKKRQKERSSAKVNDISTRG